jgi:hypothetical protein
LTKDIHQLPANLRRLAALVEDCKEAEPDARPGFHKISKLCRRHVGESFGDDSDGSDTFMPDFSVIGCDFSVMCDFLAALS